LVATADNLESAAGRYNDRNGDPQPRMRLLRTLLRMARPLRQFAPRVEVDLRTNAPDPAIAAHWGEHILLEDIIAVQHRDGTASLLRHFMTQLHSSDALAPWDEIIRTFDARRELIKVHCARLFLPDGTTRNATKQLHVVAAPDAGPNRHGRVLQHVFSPLRPGAILEFEEQFDEFRLGDLGPTMWNQFHFLTGTPCRFRRFTIAVAEPFVLHYRTHHSDLQPTERHHKGYRVFTWVVEAAEGIEWDDWTPPARDFAPWLDVTTAPRWTVFATKFREELEPPHVASPEIHSLAKEMADGKTTPVEKATAAYSYATQAVRYGRPPAETLTRNIRAATQMIQDMRGDCKDKSALLVQLLRSMKLQAEIGVVLTADSGRTAFLPSSRFNHALVRLAIDDKVYWLDAASGPFSFGELPPIDQDIPVLLLGKDGYRFDHIPGWEANHYTEHRTCTGKLTLEGDDEFRAELRYRGELSARLRMQLAHRTADHRLNVLQMWLGNDYPGAVGSDFEFGDVDDLTDGFGFTCRAMLHRIARRVKNVMLLQVPWCHPLSVSGPLSAAVRRQPLVIPPAHNMFERHTIDLPDGATVYAAPEPVALECEWGNYACTMTPHDWQLVCERRFQLRGRMVPHEHFAAFQEFWRQASWSDTAQIVLQID
jgi:hypothetical protein